MTETTEALIPTVGQTVIEMIDYTEQLAWIIEFEKLITGFLLFFVIVCLCYFGYKLFRIFF